MQCLPDEIKDRHYYEPAGMGREKQIKERLELLRAFKAGQDVDI